MTYEDIKEVVIDQLNVSESMVLKDAKFIEDLGADSLDVVELIMALEEKFDIEIYDSDAEQISTIDDAVKFINDKKGW